MQSIGDKNILPEQVYLCEYASPVANFTNLI